MVKEVRSLAVVYAGTDELDLAFEILGTLTKTPNGIDYADLKIDPHLERLRKDPRFQKLLAELASRESVRWPAGAAARCEVKGEALTRSRHQGASVSSARSHLFSYLATRD
jgi:hypothetical protein